YLGLLFIIFYSVPVLCSGLGSKRLDRIAEQKSLANQNYIARVNNMIAGVAPIRHYQGQNLFFKRFSKDLEQALQEEVSYEKQRSLNSLFINSIDAFCSVAPIVIGGFMTYQNYLSAAS
ncbi:ABC transporter ATP-binding protein, partial [Salmonella enterica subsp. enterica serovar 1,4,[5],12:i:-]|nr:ABC transporter ATP-binding protein [Salmonella enterica subsp. enterica serovar 1,4,[5],12:i:-]